MISPHTGILLCFELQTASLLPSRKVGIASSVILKAGTLAQLDC